MAAEIVLGAVAGSLLNGLIEFGSAAKDFAKSVWKHENDCQSFESDVEDTKKWLTKVEEMGIPLEHRETLSLKVKGLNSQLEKIRADCGYRKRNSSVMVLLNLLIKRGNARKRLTKLHDELKKFKGELKMTLRVHNASSSNETCKAIKSIHDQLQTQTSVGEGASTSPWVFTTVATEDKVFGVEPILKKMHKSILSQTEQITPSTPVLSSHESHPDRPEVICVHGMGGVGKTTLVKQIHDSEEMKTEFSDGIVFIHCGQERKSHDLITQALEKWEEHARRSEGQQGSSRLPRTEDRESKLKAEMKGKRFMMVIDDVWDSRQIKWAWNVASAKNTIIVTTRNRDVVTFPTAQTIHVEPLEDDDAYDMFCHCAFSNKRPPPHLETLARKVCAKCYGLPLVLQVVGSNLSVRQEDHEFWEEWLKFLERQSLERETQPGCNTEYEEVLEVMQRSIDDLSANNRPHLLDMFLELAGFPEDHLIDRDMMQKLWSVYPQVGSLQAAKVCMSTLIRLSLVTDYSFVTNRFDRKYGKVMLHDIVRHAAIRVINMRTPPPTVWDLEEGIEAVRTIDANSNNRLFVANKKPLDDVRYYGDIRKLMWFVDEGHAEGFCIKDILSIFRLPRLVSCHISVPMYYWMHRFDIDEDDEGVNKFLSPILKSKMLKTMVFEGPQSASWCQKATFFFSLDNLQALWLTFSGLYGESQFVLKPILAGLHKLQVLHLEVREYFVSKQYFADYSVEECFDARSVQELSQLRILELIGLRLNFPYLQTHASKIHTPTRDEGEGEASHCEKRIPLPLSFIIAKMPNLEVLELPTCIMISKPPADINSLGNPLHSSLLLRSSNEKLSILDLGGSDGIYQLPKEVGSPKNLRCLRVNGCYNLHSLPDSIQELTRLTCLDLSECLGLESLPHSIGGMTSLRFLSLYNCGSLLSLPDSITRLTNLTDLDLRSCGRLKILPDLKALTNLANLQLKGCLNLMSIMSFPDFSEGQANWTSLELSACYSLESLPAATGKLTNVTDLNLGFCTSLRSLPDSIQNLTGLTRLSLSNCSGLESLPECMSKLVNICKLDLCTTRTMHLRADLESLTQLTKLEISQPRYLELPIRISTLESLCDLWPSGNLCLPALPESIVHLTNLKDLVLSTNVLATNLYCQIVKLTNLTSLRLDAFQLPYDGESASLIGYDLCACERVCQPPARESDATAEQDELCNLRWRCLPLEIGNLRNLRVLRLSHFCLRESSGVHSIAQLTNLTSLEIIGHHLSDLPDSIRRLPRLVEQEFSLFP